MIPPFTTRSQLPAGIDTADWSDFVAQFSTTTARRRQLMRGLAEALEALQEAVCALAYIDGSFVTAKPERDQSNVAIKGMRLELMWLELT